ncbi:MAG: ABC transporter permease, partial [Bacteroidales bacterium]|nr:ABC transporter permease [Bacteroidales bacterium]
MRPKITIRNLLRSRLYSTIIIISLAIGIACVNLIGIFVYKEYHVDSFQKNKDNIYALQSDDSWVKGGRIYYISYDAVEYMKKNYPEIQDFCLISNKTPTKVTAGKNDYFDDKFVIAASSNFFSFFSYPLLSGKSQNVLETKQDIVISE